MELSHDTACYYKVFTILLEANLHGTSLRENPRKKIEEKKISAEQMRLDRILSYGNYSYMKKKWKTYLKHEKRNGPEWEEVLDKAGDFLSPLWNAICKDEVFFGDWMPELGRYLM